MNLLQEKETILVLLQLEMHSTIIVGDENTTPAVAW